MTATATATATDQAITQLVAPDSWQAIDFLSDLHLSEATPRTFEAFAAHLRCTDADAVLVLGDLFEAWIGDDARTQGFEKRCAETLKDAAGHRYVGFMPGNRDFLVGDALLAECGVKRLGDPCVLIAFGRRLLLSHGDAMCLADTDYQRFRQEVRAAPWRQRFLSMPIAERRRIATDLRARSREHQSRLGPQDHADVDTAEAIRRLDAAGAAQLVHGHTHRPGDHDLDPTHSRHVLSDWDFDHAGLPARGDVLRWQRSGLIRIAPRRDASC